MPLARLKQARAAPDLGAMCLAVAVAEVEFELELELDDTLAEAVSACTRPPVLCGAFYALPDGQ